MQWSDNLTNFLSEMHRAFGPISLYLKVNQFDFALYETLETHMYSLLIKSHNLQCLCGFDTCHNRKLSNFTVVFLRPVMVNQFDYPPQRAIGPATCLRVKQFDFSLFKVLATQHHWLGTTVEYS